MTEVGNAPMAGDMMSRIGSVLAAIVTSPDAAEHEQREFGSRQWT